MNRKANGVFVYTEYGILLFFTWHECCCRNPVMNRKTNEDSVCDIRNPILFFFFPYRKYEIFVFTVDLVFFYCPLVFYKES